MSTCSFIKIIKNRILLIIQLFEDVKLFIDLIRLMSRDTVKK